MTGIEQTVDVGGATVVYQVLGSGPPVVLIHGLAGSSRWWDHNIGPLSAHFRVYAVDLMGFGASDGPPFAMGEAVRRLEAWLDRIDVERAGVVGHSLGGLVALELARRCPRLVDELVLVDGAVFPPGLSAWRYLVNLGRQSKTIHLDLLPRLLRDTWRAGPSSLRSAMHDLLRSTAYDWLADVTQSTLLIWGSRDVLVPLRVAQELARLLPRAELVVIPGAGHNPQW